MGFLSGLKSVGNGIGNFVNGVLGIGSGTSDNAGTDIWDSFLNGSSNAVNRDVSAETNRTNKEIADSTNATNKAIADENLAYQREWNDYQKALQQQLFEREDSSYQRTVSDMRAAGLSPLAMNGQNAAGQEVLTSPLNNQYQEQPWQAQGYTHQSNSPAQLLSGVFNAVNQVIASKQQQDMGQAQIEKVNAETAFTNAQTDFFNVSADARLREITSGNSLRDAQTGSYKHSNDYFDSQTNLNKHQLNWLKQTDDIVKKMMILDRDSLQLDYDDMKRYDDFAKQMKTSTRMSGMDNVLSLAASLAGVDLNDRELGKKLNKMFKDSNAWNMNALADLFGVDSPSAWDTAKDIGAGIKGAVDTALKFKNPFSGGSSSRDRNSRYRR